MTLPVFQKTWTISANNRIVYTSLLDTSQRYLYGVKEFLKTTMGYVVKGSASAGTGAMDGTDRWTTSTAVSPRATIAGASQGWLVVTDGNGCDILLTFQGATDDVARISLSPGGIYVAAGTPNQQPTATDEVLVTSATSVVGTQTTQDRVWFGWGSTDKRHCRFAIARNNVWLGVFTAIEPITSAIPSATAFVGAPVVFNPPMVGIGYAPQAIFSASTLGNARVVSASVPTIASIRAGLEQFANSQNTIGTAKTELQGYVGYPILPLTFGSGTVLATGKLGNAIDWWSGRTSGAVDGDTYQLRLIAMSAGVLWPWDGSTYPTLL